MKTIYISLIGYFIIGVGGQGVTRTKCSIFDVQPPNRANTTERVRLLREEMVKIKSVQGTPLEAYIITSYDDHLNEELPERDKRLEYISGFTGGTGTVVITNQKAALWTIDLYVSQANEELPCDWLLMNESLPMSDWIPEEVQIGQRIGADPRTMPNTEWETLTKELNDKSVYLMPIKNNLVDLIWTSRPNYTFHEAIPLIYENSDLWTGKVANVRADMKEEDCDALVVTALDEISWLLNIRGRDVPYIPVLRAYLIITKDQLHLFTDPEKINDKVKTRLRIEGCYATRCVRLHRYEEIWEELVTISQKWDTVCLPTETMLTPGVSRAIFTTVPVTKRKLIVSPILLLKAEKNTKEREGMRKAHLEDAVAMCYTMAFIENKIKNGEKLDELMISDLLDGARRERVENEGISFRSIVAFGRHGSFPHYEPRNTTTIEVNKTNLLLIDSGGQYIGGTTDVARTFHFGTPTEEQKDIYTRILMGHIDVARLIFPDSVTIPEVDIIARAPLWASGRDYLHETGHGIGSFLSAHEGPILVSRAQDTTYTFEEGYFVSVEPGFYKAEEYGIRLESILEVVNSNKSDDDQRYLTFKTMTLVPFEPKLINVGMLSPDQVRWLNAYNTRIRNEVGPELKKHSLMTAFYWMMERVTHIPEVSHSYSSSTVASRENLITVFLLLVFALFRQMYFL